MNRELEIKVYWHKTHWKYEKSTLWDRGTAVVGENWDGDNWQVDLLVGTPYQLQLTVYFNLVCFWGATLCAARGLLLVLCSGITPGKAQATIWDAGIESWLCEYKANNLTL